MIPSVSARLLLGVALLLPSYALCASQNASPITAHVEIPEKVLAAHLLSSPAAKKTGWIYETMLERSGHAENHGR